MDVHQDLSRELARVISCPYPPSLTKLAGLLVHADDGTVRRCIQDRPPCAIRRLATIISDALPLWPYTLRVLQVLCQSFEFRNTLLQTNLALLDSLLSRANSSQSGFDECADVCVLLLSRPLPEALSLPASAQAFFLQVFDKAVRAPDVETLKPVYSMLSGACRGLLSLLSTEARQSFDENLCQILSSNGTGQNSMLLLWCFGIVIFAEHPQEAGNPRYGPASTSSTVLTGTSERQWTTASGRKLFGSSSGINKTINLTYLSVIWACKGDVGISDTKAIEGVKIATRAMHFVDPAKRQNWSDSSRIAASTFLKLPAKILRKDINATLQLQSLCFYAMMTEQDRLPSEIVRQYEAALMGLSDLDIDTESLREVLSISLPLFAPYLQESTMQIILETVFRTCSSTSGSRSLSVLYVLVGQLSALLPHCARLRSLLLLALTSRQVQDSLQNFLHLPAPFAAQDDRAVQCNTVSRLPLQDLQSATVALILTAALTNSSSNNRLSQDLAIALVNKQNSLARIPRQCAHSITSARPTLSLFQQECTPTTRRSQQDWRDQLKSEMEMQSTYQRDSIVRTVTLICQDLESRCENIEQPLRHERAKVKELTTQVSQLQEQLQMLETEAMDRRNFMDGLEAEKGDVENERDELFAQVDDLRLELSKANKQAVETLRAAQEDFMAKDSHFRSIILAREEELHSRGRVVDDLNNDINRLESKVQKSLEESKMLSQLHKTLRVNFDTTDNELQTERQNTARQVEEIGQLKQFCGEIEHRLKSTTTDLETLITERNKLQLQHEELIQSSEQNLQEMEARYENEIKAAAAKANEEYGSLQAKCNDARRSEEEARNAFEETRRDLGIANTTNETLEDKVRQLADTCAEKDNELHELRSLRSKVLASVGFNVDSSIPFRTNNHDAKTPLHHRRRKSAIQSVDVPALRSTAGTQGISSTAMEHLANASFTSSGSSSPKGSTPKRQKPHSLFKVPAKHAPYSSKASSASRPVATKLLPTKRSALRAISPNRRHTSVGFVPSKGEYLDEKVGRGKWRGSLDTAEQASFDMDKFLESTPFTPGNFDHGTGRMPDGGEEDTTEL